MLRKLRENNAFDKIQDVLCNAKGLMPGVCVCVYMCVRGALAADEKHELIEEC